MTKQVPTDRRWMLIIFLCALIVRLVYLALAYAGPESLRQPDSFGCYEMPARGLVDFGIIGAPPDDGTPPVPYTERMPVYILFLALIRVLFGGSPLTAMVVQIAVDAVTCMLVARLADRLRPGLGKMAGLVAAFGPNMIISSAMVLNDSLFLLPFVLFLTACVDMTRSPTVRGGVLCGLFLAIATLTRPVSLYLLALVPLLPLITLRGWGRRLVGFVLTTAVIAAVLAPWLVRNHLAADHAELSSQTGSHALYWLVPLTREYGGGISAEQARAEMNSRLAARLRDMNVERLPDNPFEASRILSSVAAQALLETPPQQIARAWVVGAVINLASPAVVAAPPVQSMERPSFFATAGGDAVDKVAAYLRAAMQGPFGWVMLSGVLFTVLARCLELWGVFLVVRYRCWRPAALVVLMLAGGYVLAVTGPVTGVKYRLPLEPILALLLAEGLNRALGWWRRRHGSARGRVAAR